MAGGRITRSRPPRRPKRSSIWKSSAHVGSITTLIKTYVRLPDLLQRRAIEGAHRIGIPTSSHEIYPAGAVGQRQRRAHRRNQPARLFSEAIGHGPIV